MDLNQDGFINYKDWKSSLCDEKLHLYYIKDVIFKRNLHTDDVLKSMNLSREHNDIDLNTLKKGL